MRRKGVTYLHVARDVHVLLGVGAYVAVILRGLFLHASTHAEQTTTARTTARVCLHSWRTGMPLQLCSK